MKSNFGRMKSKFRRVFRFLTGGSKISTERSFNFLDSAVDEAILYHTSALVGEIIRALNIYEIEYLCELSESTASP